MEAEGPKVTFGWTEGPRGRSLSGPQNGNAAASRQQDGSCGEGTRGVGAPGEGVEEGEGREWGGPGGSP